MERSRERVRRRRELARERDRAIAAAVRRYLADWQAIADCETKRDAEVAELCRQISVVEVEAAQKIETLRADQGSAAMIIRDQPGHTDDDVADLLEITPKQVRQLITLTREKTAAPSAEALGNEQAGNPIEQVRTELRQSRPDGTRPPTHSSVQTQDDDGR